MVKPFLIGLTGKAHVGKTSIAKHMVMRHRAAIVSFASPLKNMMRALGVPDEYVFGSKKNEPVKLLGGMTSRYAMQTLGTEWGRDLIDKDLWVNAWEVEYRKALYDGLTDKAMTGRALDLVLVDDVRFENEADMIKKHGGIVVKVMRSYAVPLPEKNSKHASEDGVQGYDCLVLNNESISHACDELERLAGFEKANVRT